MICGGTPVFLLFLLVRQARAFTVFAVNPPDQIELNFSATSPTDGVQTWREQRHSAMRHLALEKGLPLGHLVEVWLGDGIRLRGALRLDEEVLFIDELRNPDLVLTVENVRFKESEITSCVRAD